MIQYYEDTHMLQGRSQRVHMQQPRTLFQWALSGRRTLAIRKYLQVSPSALGSCRGFSVYKYIFVIQSWSCLSSMGQRW